MEDYVDSKTPTVQDPLKDPVTVYEGNFEGSWFLLSVPRINLINSILATFEGLGYLQPSETTVQYISVILITERPDRQTDSDPSPTHYGHADGDSCVEMNANVDP